MGALSNKHGLPQTLVNLAQRDTYTRGEAKISVTELIGSPRIRILKGRHASQITTDVSDMLWSLVGRALHSVVEHGADHDHLSEERLFADVNGWRISGGVDLQRLTVDADGRQIAGLSDYKFTSAWAVMNPKPDWERQLNCYAWLVEVTKGWVIESLAINAIVRDWSRHEAKRRPDVYPQAPAVVLPQRLWSFEERDQYVRERVLIHQDAERRDAWEEALPDCTDDERWYRPGKLAVVKEIGGRALKLFELTEREQAEALAEVRKAQIEVRPGGNTRCESFCPMSEWCDQYARLRGGEEGK